MRSRYLYLCLLSAFVGGVQSASADCNQLSGRIANGQVAHAQDVIDYMSACGNFTSYADNGITTPSTPLDVARGTLRLSSDHVQFYIRRGGKDNALYIDNDGTKAVMYMTNEVDQWSTPLTFLLNGNVGIQTRTPGYTLHVNGTVYAEGIAGALSDFRDKSKISPLADGALSLVEKLRPVTFVWKKAKDAGMTGTQTGLIAQDVERILPSSILTASDKRKSKAIKYNELTVILIKAMQEQQKQIAKLNLENANLQKRISKLEGAK